MCDYSLHAFKNRLAVDGESLTIHKFYSGSKGMAAPAEIKAARPRGLKRLWNLLIPEDRRTTDQKITAVCIPPGARLRLGGIPKRLQTLFEVSESEVVPFVQLPLEPFRYRDAVRFSSDFVALLQNFDEGLRVEVISFELEEEPEIDLTDEPVDAPTNPGERGMYSNG